MHQHLLLFIITSMYAFWRKIWNKSCKEILLEKEKKKLKPVTQFKGKEAEIVISNKRNKHDNYSLECIKFLTSDYRAIQWKHTLWATDVPTSLTL